MTTDATLPCSPAKDPPDEQRVRGHFSPRHVIGPAEPDGRHQVFDPDTRQRWRLGPAELAAARQFTEGQTYAAVVDGLRKAGIRPPGITRIKALEDRLLAAGLLRETASDARTRRLMPLALACVRRFTSFDLLAFAPGPILDAVHSRLPWLTSRTGVRVLSVLVAAVLGTLCAHAGTLVAEVPAALRGWGLPMLYLVCAFSSVFHEGGHALACRGLGIAVEEIGVGIRSLVVFAWTEPEQDSWSRLRRSDRLVTIAAGPFGSLVFTALSGLVWLAGGEGTAARRIAVLCVLAGTVAVIPTLLPIFKGDAYLLLTDMLGWPNLRPQAFEELRRTVLRSAGGQRPDRRTRAVFLTFALTTIVGHTLVTAFVLWLIWTCGIGPLTGRPS